MKKKKILYTTLTTGVVAASASIVAVSSVDSQSNQHISRQSSALTANKSISFDGKDYNSADEAINDVLRNVQSKEYLGDVSSAISSSNHNAIDVSRLIEKNDTTMSKISKAYKTLSGSYTSNYRTAQESYVKDPTFSYLDYNGNEFDSELDATNSIKSDVNSYSNEVAYYNVNDYSKTDSNGQPTTVKINPLNATDVDALKELAIKNSTISNSGFSINRYKSNSTSKTYGANNYVGETNAEIDSRVDNLEKGVTDIIKKSLWLNTKLSVTPDKKIVKLVKRTMGYGTWSDSAKNVSMNWTVSGNDSSVGSSYDDIVKDSQYLTSNDYLIKKFNKQYQTISWQLGNWAPFANLQSKSSIFGQKYSITLDNGKKIFNDYNYYLRNTKKQADFLGAGALVNGYFDLSWNQDGLSKKLDSDSNFKAEMTKKAEQVKSDVTTYLKLEFQKIGSIDDATSQAIEKYAEVAKNLVLSNVVGSTNISVANVKSTDQVAARLDSLNDVLLTKLNTTPTGSKTTDSSSFTNLLTSFLKQNLQTNEANESNNDVIYTIDYNGVPLFWIQKEAYNSIIGNEDFLVEPLKAIEKYFNSQLSTNYSEFSKLLAINLKNISNSLSVTNGSFSSFTTDGINNYNSNKKVSSIKLSSDNVSNLDAKKVDESCLTSNGIQTTELDKSLNIKEDDTVGNLNSSYGTFQAIYDYNKSLDKYSKLANVSETLKSEVKTNAITDPNNIVVLYSKDKTPEQIRYGQYLNYGYKFNANLANGDNKVYNSFEKIKSDFTLNNLGSPKKLVTFSDYDGNVLVKEVIDKVGGTYDTAIQQARENAINKVKLPATSDYVYYTNDDDSKTLVKNESTKLYVVSWSNSSTRTNFGTYRVAASSNTTTYGFSSYSDLQSFVRDEVYISNGQVPPSSGNSGNGSSSSTQYRQSANAVTQSVTITITLLLFVEGLLLFIYVYSKFKKKNIKVRKLNTNSGLLYKLNIKK